MKKCTLIITENDDGEMTISAKNDGFDVSELYTLLELKAQDLLVQLKSMIDFHRTAMLDGKAYSITESEVPNE